MKRIVEGMRMLECDRVTHVETSDVGGERLISKATGVEIAYIKSSDFRVLFSNPKGDQPFIPGGLHPPEDVQRLMDVVNAVFRWLREEAAPVSEGTGAYEGMRCFYVTFGQKHPLKDSYVVIYAHTEQAARNAPFSVLGPKWSISSDLVPESSLFPQGAYGSPIKRYEI